MPRLSTPFAPARLAWSLLALCLLAGHAPALIAQETQPATAPQSQPRPPAIPPGADGLTPEQVMATAVQAMSEERLEDFARLMHPDAVATIKEFAIEVVRLAEDGGDEHLARMFSSATTVEELKAKAPHEVFAEFLGGILQAQPAMRQALASTTVEMIGATTDDQGATYAVYRQSVTTQGITMTQLTVTALRPSDAGWRIELKGDMDAMIQTIRAQIP